VPDELFDTGIEKGAEFSTGRTYRYSLWRVWDRDKPLVMFIGLNPSTADESKDDPTIRRCIGFAKRWAHGGIVMCNLFAFRATDPKAMKKAADPVGRANDQYLKHWASRASLRVACWGNHGAHLGRAAAVCKLLQGRSRTGLDCFGRTKQGQPKHPLYLPGNARTQLLEEVK
jgi:hypothetical protein